jgi:hypothetical protein
MRLTVGELVDQYVATLRLLGRTSADLAASIARRRLQPKFGTLRVAHLTTPMMKQHLKDRIAAGAAPATAMKDIWILSAAFHMAHEEHRVTVLPVFPYPSTTRGRGSSSRRSSRRSSPR